MRARARIEKISSIRVDSVSSCEFLKESIKFLSTVHVSSFLQEFNFQSIVTTSNIYQLHTGTYEYRHSNNFE